MAVFTFVPWVSAVTLTTMEQEPGGKLSAPAWVKTTELAVVATVAAQVFETTAPTVSPTGRLSTKPVIAPKTNGLSLLVKVSVSRLVWPTKMVVGEKLFVKTGATTFVVAVAINPAKLPVPVALLFFIPTISPCIPTVTLHVAGLEATVPPVNVIELIPPGTLEVNSVPPQVFVEDTCVPMLRPAGKESVKPTAVDTPSPPVIVKVRTVKALTATEEEENDFVKVRTCACAAFGSITASTVSTSNILVDFI